jgi:hypothetical protein
LLTAFPLTEIDRVVRRTVIACIVVGVVGCALAILLGHPFFAPGLIIGLALALVNHRVFQSSALRFTTTEGVLSRKPFAGSVALRLGLCTAIAVGLLVVDPALGWGVIAGLAVFQASMLLNAVIALARYQRQQVNEITGTGSPDA